MGSNRFTRIITPEQRKAASESTGQYRRKSSAIFSADVQGYSRLMGSNEEMTVQTIITYRDLISRVIHYNSGRVVDSPGDNILAEFENPTDAVNSSLEIQKQINERNQELSEKHQMKFRIGLNFGEIIEEDGRLYGDGVNIAARLESLAEGGGICISGTIYDHIKGKVPVKVDYLGAKPVKNISKNVPTYKIVMDTGINAVKHETKIVLAPLIITAFLSLMYMLHFRYLLSDIDVMPYLILNPLSLIEVHYPYFIGLALGIIIYMVYVHKKRGVGLTMLRLFYGT
jgi:class 3 adenylate cyclase